MRLRMLALLKDGELCVCQIMEVVNLAASTTSEHLSELRRAGLLQERKEGRWVYVGLSDDTQVQTFLETLWPSLDADPQIQKGRERAQAVRLAPLVTTCARMNTGIHPSASR
jgi:DNA-binding transcriptional ArsR family regulator